MMNGGGVGSSQHDSRPPSSVKTGSSFDFANRPPTTNYGQVTALPHNSIGNLSRTDQIVLRHFWDVKYAENKSRDLHFVGLQGNWFEVHLRLTVVCEAQVPFLPPIADTSGLGPVL
jgi:hypothetical protein